MTGEQLKGHLDGLILAVLEQGPAHGYAVIESLKQRSDGRFDLPEGTIYPALHRLEAAGALASRREVTNGRERRVYRLAATGRRSLELHRTIWKEFSAAMTQVLTPRSA